MPKFFVEDVSSDKFAITGENAHHMIKSLRMRKGDMVTVSDGKGIDCGCEIASIEENCVWIKVLYRQPSQVEANVQVTLYQGLPKSDKMDTIIQKAVELGVYRIVPILTERSVSRPEGKALKKKQERWQKIAEEAAKQSGRGIIPEVAEIIPLHTIDLKNSEHLKILFYECGGTPIKKIFKDYKRKIDIYIGPEGGWSPKEVEILQSAGVKIATLGPRILRTETASMTVLSVLMYVSGNLE